MTLLGRAAKVAGAFVLLGLFIFSLAAGLMGLSFSDAIFAKAAADVGSKIAHKKTMATIVRNTTNGRASIIALLSV